MIDLTNCAQIGTITKTHGVKGQVALRLKQISSDSIKQMEWVFIEQDGLPVPFCIYDYYTSTPDTIVLSLDSIENPNTAQLLVDDIVWIDKKDLEKPSSSQDANDPALLIGYTIIDTKLGEIGVLDDILDFDQNPLFRILHKRKEILIPIQPEFIIEVNDAQQTITVQTPAGLLDLF